MRSKKKSALTLAEIMIVIVIVAIIAGIFLAMPKKNIGRNDRAKYYIAYSTLKQLMDEQMAQEGEVAINFDYNNNDTIDNNEKFDTAVNKWLNVLESTTDNNNTKQYNNGDNVVTLTNNMKIRWDKNNNAATCAYNNNKSCLKVTIDLDGENCDGKGKDCHEFTLDTTGFVIPVSNSNWINFIVYHIGDDGKTKIDKNNVPFIEAFEYYCCRNGGIKGAPCKYVDSETSAIITLNESYCKAEAHNHGWKQGAYFMEAIPPLK